MSPEAYLDMAQTEATHWWFVGRRTVLTSVIERLALGPQARILEIGCGTGGNLPMLSAFGQVHALEMDDTARAIAADKTGNRFDIRAGFCPTDIPFRDQKFDLICLFDVLEHIEQDNETLAAARDMLAENGRIVMTVPAYSWMWGPHDEFLHHKRRYTARELRTKLDHAQLQSDKLTHFNMFLFPIAALTRIKDRLLRSATSSGTATPPGPINSAFRRTLGLESRLLRNVDLPFGLSLLAVVRAR
jgi:SAM-dependent methyltransferase